MTLLFQYIHSKPNQIDVLKGFIPGCNNCSVDVAEQGLGLVGAIIMPHNIYLHSGLVLVSKKDFYLYRAIQSCLSSLCVHIQSISA